MTRRAAAVGFALGLAGCWETPPEEEACFWVFANPVEAVLPGDRGPQGAAFALDDLRGLAETTRVEGSTVELLVTNEGVAEDCVVAIYVSEDEPRRGALPALDAAAPPPAEVEGLGVLVDSANLAADRAAHPDAVWFSVELPASGGFVTVAACPESVASIQAEAQADVCAEDWDADPRADRALSQVW